MKGRGSCSCDEHYLVMSNNDGKFMDYQQNTKKFNAIYMDPIRTPNPYQKPLKKPTCGIHKDAQNRHRNTVSAYCYDTPIHHWGYGREGIQRAVGNCNHAASIGRFGVC